MVKNTIVGKFKYKNYLLIVLTIVSVFNYLDRFVISLLLESIKQDLQLSDSQLGLLTGFAFALFYAVAGVPIARWADQGNRNTIVSLTTALWSFMLALSSIVSSFAQLLLVRIGVAIGEAGCLPAAQSWISDYFDRIERPHAMSIYFMSYPIAVIVGYLGGGWLAEMLGWRVTFIVIGLPGVFLALLVRFSLPEPRIQDKHYARVMPPSFREVLKSFWLRKSFRHIVLAYVIGNLFGVGILMWLPTFFVRSHGMELSEVGAWMAITAGVCGMLGVYLGGRLATRYAGGRESLQLKISAFVFVVSGCLYIAAYLASNQYYSIGLIGVITFCASLTSGPIFSAIQSLVEGRMRAISIALLFFLVNLIGMGLGPMLAGALSDLLEPRFGINSLRYALVILSPGYLWAAFHYLRASHTVEADIASLESHENPISLNPKAGVVLHAR